MNEFLVGEMLFHKIACSAATTETRPTQKLHEICGYILSTIQPLGKVVSLNFSIFHRHNLNGHFSLLSSELSSLLEGSAESERSAFL